MRGDKGRGQRSGGGAFCGGSGTLKFRNGVKYIFIQRAKRVEDDKESKNSL